jgi:hypothetical protein
MSPFEQVLRRAINPEWLGLGRHLLFYRETELQLRFSSHHTTLVEAFALQKITSIIES